MSHVDALFSLTGPEPDPDEFVRAAVRWHFDPNTGSPFWLRRAQSLEFDPLTDVKSFDDLKLFPNVVNELRDVVVEDLIPRGYGPEPEVAYIIESGGTTGAPKTIPILREWWDLSVANGVKRRDAQGEPRNAGTLALQPSGPHLGGQHWRRVSQARGNMTFAVDMDPRWVKKLIASGRGQEADEYADHIIEQAEWHLRSQNISVLRGTPPLLILLSRRDDLLELIQEKIKFIGWGGAHMDPDTRYLLRTEVFPGITMAGGYATTMALGAGATERPGLSDDDPCIFDAFTPYVTLQVVDETTRESVLIGERGRVLVHHVSPMFFMPNNLERDLATRVAAQENGYGDTIADIGPVEVFDGERVIEGVY